MAVHCVDASGQDKVDAAAVLDEAAIIAAFKAAAQGHSSDELLINNDLRSKFLEVLADGSELSRDQERESLLKLLRLRKAGKLKQKATATGPRTDVAIVPIAEMAARVVIDRHDITTDSMMADKQFRNELQREAEKILPGVDAYAVRKSVLKLRKKRALKPELVLKATDWQREILVFRLSKLREQLASKSVSSNPAIYVFRSQKEYLYVGEAENLAKRLTQHLRGSDRELLADYLAGANAKTVTVELHVFAADSPAKDLARRRAYESELIRSRKPKFNERP